MQVNGDLAALSIIHISTSQMSTSHSCPSGLIHETISAFSPLVPMNSKLHRCLDEAPTIKQLWKETYLKCKHNAIPLSHCQWHHTYLQDNLWVHLWSVFYLGNSSALPVIIDFTICNNPIQHIKLVVMSTLQLSHMSYTWCCCLHTMFLKWQDECHCLPKSMNLVYNASLWGFIVSIYRIFMALI